MLTYCLFACWCFMSHSDAAVQGSKPLAIVTGANTGIGFHVAEDLASRGFHVILACRSLDRGAEALAAAQQRGSAELRRLDLASFASVRTFASDLQTQRLDLLVCNAGMNSASAKQEPSEQLSEDKVDILYQTNYLSHFLLTLLLLPLLRRARGRVISVSSVVHRSASLEDFDRTRAVREPYASLYGLSKLAQIVSSYALHARYGEEVSFHCVNPGGVGSDIWRGFPGWQQKIFSTILITPATAASTVVTACTSPDAAAPCKPRTGNGYKGADRSVLLEFWSPFPARERLVESQPSQDHQDPQLAEKLWEQSLSEIRAAGVELDVP
ncbi:unnamed protein product [Durusdinium trenchii]|uniref:Uncharacterized protein n=1 Tax=Durusdinium trenchii TaxID=1381693 RepID=A0ABP0JAK0_9DINO